MFAFVLSTFAVNCKDGESLTANCNCTQYIRVSFVGHNVTCAFQPDGNEQICEPESYEQIFDECLCPSQINGIQNFVGISNGRNGEYMFCSRANECYSFGQCSSYEITNCSIYSDRYYIVGLGKSCYWCPDNMVCNGVTAFQCPSGAECNDFGIVDCGVDRYIADNQSACLKCPENYTCDGQILQCANDVSVGTFQCQCGTKDDQFQDEKGFCRVCPNSQLNVLSCYNGEIQFCTNDHFLSKNKTECIACPLGGWCKDNRIYCFHNVVNGTKLLDNYSCICHSTTQYMDESNKCQPCLGICAGGKHEICPTANMYVLKGRCYQCPANMTCDGSVNLYCNDNILSGTNGCSCKSDSTQLIDEKKFCRPCPYTNLFRCFAETTIFNCLDETPVELGGCECKIVSMNVVPSFSQQQLLCSRKVEEKLCQNETALQTEECQCNQSRLASYNGTHYYCVMKMRCTEIPGMVCGSSNKIVRCPNSTYFAVSTGETVCNVCPLGYLCDGTTTIQQCKESFCYLGVPTACPLDANCKDGFATCKTNQYLKAGKCVSCDSSLGEQCNGTMITKCEKNTTWIPKTDGCKACPSTPFVQMCYDNKLVYPKNGVIDVSDQSIISDCDYKKYPLLSADKRQCLPCPAFSTCNGSQNYDCDATFIKNAYNYCVCLSTQFISHELKCEACPKFGSCNGMIITACSNGFQLIEQTCRCLGNQFIYNDDLCGPCMANGICKDGNVTCNTGYVLNDDSDECVCGQGSIEIEGKCVCQPGFFIDVTKNCVKCIMHGECDGTNVISCDDGFSLTGQLCSCLDGRFVNKNNKCIACPANADCKSGVFECKTTFTKDQNTENCVCNSTDNQYQQGNYCVCQNEMFFNIQSNLCIECPKFGICNGSHLIFCEPNRYYDSNSMQCKLIDQNCVDCHYDKGNCSYDENEVLSCSADTECQSNFNLSTFCRECNNGYVYLETICLKADCTGTQFLNIETQSCQDCPAYATCNGLIFSCNKGFTTDKYQCKCENKFINNQVSCIACPSNASCDEQGAMMCLDSFTPTDDKQRCTCKANQYLLLDRCQECPAHGNCNGNIVVSCQDGFELENDICTCYPGSMQQNSQCVPCPANGQCDGQVIISCSNGFIISTDKTSCICQTNSLVNHLSECVLCPKYAQCKNNIIETCKETFNLNQYKDECVCNHDQTLIDDQCRCQSNQYLNLATKICTDCPVKYAKCDGISVICDENYEFKADHCSPITKNCSDCKVESGSCQQIGNGYFCSPDTVCKTGFDFDQFCRKCERNYVIMGGICELKYCIDKSQFIFDGICVDCPDNGVCDGEILMCDKGFEKRDEVNCVEIEVENGTNVWAIVGIVAASILVLVVLAVLIFIFVRKYLENKKLRDERRTLVKADRINDCW